MCGSCGGEYACLPNCAEARARREIKLRDQLEDLRGALRLIARMGGAAGEVAKAALREEP